MNFATLIDMQHRQPAFDLIYRGTGGFGVI
jgi:hypothetical protein